MAANEEKLERELTGMVRSSATLMAALAAARDLKLASWCIGAGAVRSLVWDCLHGYATPSRLDDVDIAYYEETTGPARDAELEKILSLSLPGVRWEVTNQATIHRWFRDHLAQDVAPLRSLEEGIATWPEYATCVGVTLRDDDGIAIIAPHGLGDLFGLRVRHNPIRASADVYKARAAAKRFAERWPLVCVVPV